MIQALIFDMDGLMIDSERLYFRAEREIAARYEKPLDEAVLWRMMGRNPKEGITIFVRELGLPASVDDVLALRNDLMRELLQTDLVPLPGLDRIIADYRGRLKLAVCTGAQREFLDIVLDGLGIRDVFSVLQASDEITRGKPDPEIYKETIRKLGLKSEDCVVLEDSENGVLAGSRAGCTVIAVPSEYTRTHDFSPADMVVRDLNEAAERIEALLLT